ncbi:MAG: hypothetical protein AB7G15_10950 [Alphaproteobacteria bacterium]
MSLSKELKILTGGALAAAIFATGLIVGNVSADQPRMHAAKRNLEAARAELQAATADKGGHRVRALNLVDQAIAEVNAGIRFDRRN